MPHPALFENNDAFNALIVSSLSEAGRRHFGLTDDKLDMDELKAVANKICDMVTLNRAEMRDLCPAAVPLWMDIVLLACPQNNNVTPEEYQAALLRLALAILGPPPSLPATAMQLTPSEREMAALVSSHGVPVNPDTAEESLRVELGTNIDAALELGQFAGGKNVLIREAIRRELTLTNVTNEPSSSAVHLREEEEESDDSTEETNAPLRRSPRKSMPSMRFTAWQHTKAIRSDTTSKAKAPVPISSRPSGSASACPKKRRA